MGKQRGLIIIIVLTCIFCSFSAGLCSDTPQESSDTGDSGELTAQEIKDILERLKNAERKLDAQEKIMLSEEQILVDQGNLLNTLQNASKIPAWLKNVKLSEDFRFRLQGDFFSQDNAELMKPSEPDTIMNTHQDRKRVRIRLRLSLIAKVNERMDIGTRLTTGNEKEPVSTNETLGDYCNKDGIVFDRAYLRWQPIQKTALWFGRIPNPFDSTDLVWDKDINLEGLALTVDTCDEKSQAEKRWNGGGFFTGGIFPLQEVEFSSKDKYFYGGQIGVKYDWLSLLGFKLAVAYYDYQNIEGEFNEPLQADDEKDYTLPAFQQKGNTLFDINTKITDTGVKQKLALASDYNQLDINGSFDIAFFNPVIIRLMADYVKNIGFDKEKVNERTGYKKRAGQDIPEKTQGYQAGVSVGHREVKDLWQWNCSFFLKHLEADAVIDAFTDSDFHLGGTNAEGWILNAQLGVAKNAWLSFTWLTADEIDGPPLAVDVLQIDLNACF
ncbi:MAG: putative porin [bacterium]